jgi:hypothetical protein
VEPCPLPDCGVECGGCSPWSSCLPEQRHLSSRKPEATTREAVIEQAQTEKVKTLHPYVPGKGEAVLNRAEEILANGVRWHPFFNNAYSDGGFTVGIGYGLHVSPYNMIDVRGSYTALGYKRVEAEFTAPVCFTAAARCLSSAAGARRHK